MAAIPSPGPPPMHPLDLRTVILISGLLGLLLSAVLFGIRRTYPAHIQGLGTWAWAPLSALVASVLLAGRGALPDNLMVIMGNSGVVLAMGLFLTGTRQFYGEPVHRAVLPGVLLLTLLPMWWWTTWHVNHPSRVMFFCAVNLCIHLAHIKVIWRHDHRSFAARFVMAVLAGHSLILVVRAVSLWGSTQTLMLQPSPIQTVYVTSFSVCMLLLTLGLVLLVAERLRLEYEHLATHDTVTGALSRHAIMRLCEQALARSHRHGHPLTVMMLDLDHFKQVNDQHGHLAGDRVLADFVQRVQSLLRATDSLGRYGGEEFMVLLPDTPAADALVVAERIRASRPHHSHLPPCTVSIGLAACQPGQGETVDQLLSRADDALYAAKRQGRNRTETAPMPPPVHLSAGFS